MKALSTIFICLVALFIGWAVFVLPFVGWHRETGRGEAVGYVTATESNGVIFKTNRAYVKTDAQSSQEDTYCVMDDAVFSDLRKASYAKEKVTISFLSYIEAGITNCDGEDAIIYGVK